MHASLEELINVDEIGEVIAKSVIRFFNDSINIQIIEKLKSEGLQLELSPESLEGQTDKLKDLIFVVSGVFEKISRPELKKSIEDNGGKVSSSISKKTNYIVAGDNMGPSKRAKAESLNIPIITENDYLKMIS